MNAMMVECPACRASYALAIARKNQRLVRIRCSQCAHGWIERVRAFDTSCDVNPPPVEVILPTASSPVSGLDMGMPRQPSATGAPVAEQRVRFVQRSADVIRSTPDRRRFSAARTFGVSICGLALCGLLIAKREAVVRLAPSTAWLYAGIGLGVNTKGLVLREVKSVLADEGAQRILMVEGQIVNVRPGTTQVPDLRVSVRAENGREIYHWDAPPQKKQLATGETIVFRARLVAAPQEARDVKVQFADAVASAGEKPIRTKAEK